MKEGEGGRWAVVVQVLWVGVVVGQACGGVREGE